MLLLERGAIYQEVHFSAAIAKAKHTSPVPHSRESVFLCVIKSIATTTGLFAFLVCKCKA